RGQLVSVLLLAEGGAGAGQVFLQPLLAVAQLLDLLPPSYLPLGIGTGESERGQPAGGAFQVGIEPDHVGGSPRLEPLPEAEVLLAGENGSLPGEDLLINIRGAGPNAQRQCQVVIEGAA